MLNKSNYFDKYGTNMILVKTYSFVFWDGDNKNRVDVRQNGRLSKISGKQNICTMDDLNRMGNSECESLN